MKRPLLTSRRKVMSALINAYPGGRECAAAQLGLELKKFDNQAYESNGHRPLADEQIYLLEQVTGTTLLPDYICRLYGGVFVPMPADTELDNLDLYQRSRVARTARIVLSSREMGRIYHAKGVERLVRNDLWRGRTPERFYDAMEWLYGWNVTNCLARD